RYTRLRSQAPLVLRPTPDGVYLVGGAAGPMGGDAVTIEVDVRPGARLTMRSAAASVALPGPHPSVVSVRAHVAKGAMLRWQPEPTVLVTGCRHHLDAHIEVEDGGSVEWIEELLLGRHGEPSGSVVSRLHVDYAGRPLLRHELALGPEHPGWDSPAVTGGARAVGSLLVIGDRWTTCDARPHAAVMQLDGPGVQVVALAGDRLTLASALRKPADLHP
ncbi:MAG: urease accessory protein UreD, partial [Acidimicrobiales bacterium]